MKRSKKINFSYARILLKELVKTDFKIRYQGSVLGYAWSLLRPTFLFLILYTVFAKFLKIGSDIPNYPIYLLLGVVLWTFFTDITTQGLASVVSRGDLIRKIRIPRTVIVLSVSVSALINLTLNTFVIFIFATINNLQFSIQGLWLIPLVLELYILGLGVAFLLSAMFVKLRDLSYVWELLIQAGFYVTPILYPLSLITEKATQKLIMLNPVAQIIQDARYAFVTKKTDTISIVYDNALMRLVPIFITILIFIIGFMYFKKSSKNFAENL